MCQVKARRCRTEEGGPSQVRMRKISETCWGKKKRYWPSDFLTSDCVSEQPSTYYLYCIRFYKQCRDDLKYTGGCV